MTAAIGASIAVLTGIGAGLGTVSYTHLANFSGANTIRNNHPNFK